MYVLALKRERSVMRIPSRFLIAPIVSKCIHDSFPQLLRFRSLVAVAATADYLLVETGVDLEAAENILTGLLHNLLRVLDPLHGGLFQQDGIVHEHDRHDTGLTQPHAAMRIISAPPLCIGKLYKVRLFGLVLMRSGQP